MPASRRVAVEGDAVGFLRSLTPEERERRMRRLGPGDSETLDRAWRAWAHGGQRPPAGDGWRTWVLMAGRGFGKTYAGAHWIADAAKADGSLRVALVAATVDEARSVMVEGKSGLLAAAGHQVDDWQPSRRLIRFRSGAEATLFSGCSPEKLRGPEHGLAWCDELAKWARPRETWDMLQLGLRLGEHPRALVTTTPRPGPVLHAIMAEPGCVATGGRTGDNPHVSPAFQDTVERLYRGTRLGAQELDGVLLPDGGALWTPEVLEGCREQGTGSREQGTGGWTEPGPSAWNDEGGARTGVAARPPVPCSLFPVPSLHLTRTVIGVDPPSGDGTCGIVACAVGADGIGHVLADHSVSGRSQEGWARAVADAAAVHGTRAVVAERNQGGRMVEAVLRAADGGLRVKLVHAADGKAARADPVALLFEAGRVRLHGRLPELEAELLGLVAGAPYQGPGPSPDRADAMVWALTELMLGRSGAPGVRVF